MVLKIDRIVGYRSLGVGDGIRTRDVQSHSLALYQLSYTHRIGVLRSKKQYYVCNIRGQRVSTRGGEFVVVI